MSHEHTWIHKTHHDLDLGEATTFPFIIFFLIVMGFTLKCHFSRDSQVGNLKIPKFETPTSLEAHNLLCKLLIEASYKTKL